MDKIKNTIKRHENYYKLTLAYDGTNYCGWQLQKNGLSVHEAMMKAGSRFLEDGFTITGCSRTDSGVHALGFVALLSTEKDIELRRIPNAFNAHLPKDIVVHKCEKVEENFHPRYSAKFKHYRYTISNHPFPIPQYVHYAYYYQRPLDADKMNKAAKAFVGRHDFVGFSSVKTTVKDTVRTIVACKVTRENAFIHIDVIGDGFLYNMVRIIAGSLIDVGLGKIQPDDMQEIIESKDRNRAKKTAPAKGLTLKAVYYEELKNGREDRIEEQNIEK